MAWTLVWADRALKDTERLDRRARERVVRALERLAETGHGDVMRLEAAKPEWRLRVGAWRVRFVFDYSTRSIQVVRVLPRGRAYRD